MPNSPASDYEPRKREEVGYFRYLGGRLVMPPTQGYWAERFLRPKLQAVGLGSLRSFHQHSVASLCEGNPRGLIEVASVGAGYCQHEIRLATQLRARGITNFRIDCVDMNGQALVRARKAAEEAGVIENLGFVVSDWDLVDRTYSACFAIQALHHFVELETVFTKVRPRRLQVPQPPEVPRRRVRRSGLGADQPRGIRAQDILPLLMQIFHFEVFVAVRNVDDPFLGLGYGPNFSVRRKEDRAFIRRVARLDDRLIDEGVVKPTRLIAWLRTEPVASMRCYRHWTPEHCVRRPDAGADSGPRPVPNGAGGATR